MGLETGPQAHSWVQWVSTYTPESQQLVCHAGKPAAAHQTIVDGNGDAENIISLAWSQTSYNVFPAVVQ